MQRITVTCEQMYEGDDAVNASATHESLDMGLDGWRYAIEGAAVSAGFSIHLLNQMIIDWADSLGEQEKPLNMGEFYDSPM